MPSHLGKGIDAALNNLDINQSIPLNDKIPLEPQQFYAKLGYLRHSRTGQLVTSLTQYQVDAWKGLHQHKRVLVVKSNRVGVTTSTLMLDFQLALLPTSNPLSTRGYDTLLIAQTKEHSKEHLRTLRKMIMDSPTYAKYLIESPTEIGENGNEGGDSFNLKKVMRSEQTKTSVIYIRNPENEKQPSRIIALGLNNAGALLSWRNVKHLHLSDPTAAEGDITEALDNALTRLANTNGSCIIETVPGGPNGKIYDMWLRYHNKEWQPGDFKVYEIQAYGAVQAGIITQEFLDGEKRRLGHLFGQYYEAKFISATGNAMFEPSSLEAITQEYNLALGQGIKVLAVDFGFGSSKTAIAGLEAIDSISYVKLAEQWERPGASNMLDRIAKVYHEGRYTACCIDASQPGLIQDLQNGSNDGTRQTVNNVIPIVFGEKLSEMVAQTVAAVKEKSVRIHPSFTELLSQLRAVQFNEKGNPDKKKITFDLGDAFMMAVSYLANRGPPITFIESAQKLFDMDFSESANPYFASMRPDVIGGGWF